MMNASVTQKVYVHPSVVLASHRESDWLGIALDIDEFHGGVDETVIPALRNPETLALVRALKPRVLRIGGGGIEQTYITLNGKTTGLRSDPLTYPMRKVIPPVELTDWKLDAIGEFSREVDTDLMQSFPMRFEEDPETAIRILEYLSDKTPGRIRYLEFSNEPDYCWFGHQERYPELVVKFHELLAPLYPEVKWVAGYGGSSYPYTAGNPDNEKSYLALFDAAGDRLDIVSAHSYACSSSKEYAKNDLLMQPVAANIKAARIDELQMMMELSGMGRKDICINEFNVMARKGAEGISNAAAGALYICDVLGHLSQTKAILNCVQASVAGHHCNQPFWRYALVDTRDPQKPRVNPHYFTYQLWHCFMARASIGTMLATDPELSFHATVSQEGDLRAVVVNKSQINAKQIALEVVDGTFSGRCRELSFHANAWDDVSLLLDGRIAQPAQDVEDYPWCDAQPDEIHAPPVSMTFLEWKVR